MRLHRLSPLLAAILLLAGSHLAPAQDNPRDAVSEAPHARDLPQGRIVEGPRNIRDFDPEDTSQEINATDLNLRKVFEDLGPDATLWYQHVQTLANPFFEGRAPGTRGGDLAAEYIEFYFREYGLQPAFSSTAIEEIPGGAESPTVRTSHRQEFDLPSPDPKIGVEHAEARVGENPLARDRDFTVLGVSGNGEVTAPVTFVGYAIEHGQDDYTSFDANVDLTGRIAIVLRYEPLNDEGRSRWAEARFSRFANIAPKLKALVERNAAGIILVNPPGAVDGRPGLESLSQSSRFGSVLSVPAVQMTADAADDLLRTHGADLLALRKQADAGTIKTLALPDDVQVTLSTRLIRDDRLHTQNVAGVLPGRGDLADQWIIIGAHYDHVGYGYTGAMPDNIGMVHPGADDNASGTAGLLIAAKRMAHLDQTSPGSGHRRSIMFVAFGAEEAGLHGSKHFVEHSVIPADSIFCMLNMDMIGRLRSHNVLVQGTGTAKEFDAILKPHFEASGLTVSTTPSGRGPSDHASFFNAGVPVLFFFTGEHNEYHKPVDRAYTLNPAGAVAVVDLLESVTVDLLTHPERLTFVNASAAGATRRSAARVRLGLMPAYNAEMETGVLVEAVTDGTSAAEADIRAGDVLLSWNGEEISGGQKLSELLAAAAPGDRVQITLQRGDRNLTANITLKARD